MKLTGKTALRKTMRRKESLGTFLFFRDDTFNGLKYIVHVLEHLYGTGNLVQERYLKATNFYTTLFKRIRVHR